MPALIEPRLLADIGSTFARFAVEREPGVFAQSSAVRCDQYPDLLAALRAYLASVDGPAPRHGAIAIANPVEGDLVRMTNYKWQFSIEQLRAAVGFETLVVVNDFTALAMALPHLGDDAIRQVGGGSGRERSVLGVLGAGTGLGVSGLVPVDDGWVSLASEGGHVAFAPRNARELFVLEYAWRQYAHVSAERLVSASGIELIHRALAARAERAVEPLTAPEIARRAVAGECALCVDAIDVFCEMLGTVAANLAVTLGAFGGVYIGGGIVPRLGDHFDRSGFRARFESKGRFSEYVAHIPTFVITTDTPTFTGVSAILNAQLKKRSGGATLLERVRLARTELSAAEQRVADLVLSQPRSVLNDPIVDIARSAGVSQPTVVRFCRSLGYAGLSDFKLKLASGLTSTIPVSHTQVRRTDSALELGAKVLDNTAAALFAVRDQLSNEAVERAIDLLLAARRVECYAIGNYAVVAQDAQYKLLRFGVPAAAVTEPRLQAMAAAALGADDVVIAVSGSGRMTELLKSVDAALAAGATVIALSPSHSPLAKRASQTIAIDHPEDVATQVPMISRILYLAVIDILAVGVAMRRSGEARQARTTSDGTTPAPDFARMTSHAM
jgi:glucokinase